MIAHGTLEVSIKAKWETCDKFGCASQASSSLDCDVIMRVSRVPKCDVFSNLQLCDKLKSQEMGKWALGLTESGKWV
jgi:hypothetical protein